MPPLLLRLKDEEYPYSGYSHTRLIARAFVIDERGYFALHRVYRDDIFGKQAYFETPGGGVEAGETPEQAIRRECQEELGEEVEIIELLGEVVDAYNLIRRRNRNLYFLCRRLSSGDKRFASSGDLFIQSTERIPLREMLSRYEGQDDHGVAGLVKRRELPFVRLLLARGF